MSSHRSLAAAPQAADGSTVALRRPLARYSTSAAAISSASGSRWRPAKRLRSSSALRMSASFFGAHPASRADPAVRGGRSSSSSVADVSSR